MYSISLNTKIILSWSQPWFAGCSFHRHYDPRIRTNSLTNGRKGTPRTCIFQHTFILHQNKKIMNCDFPASTTLFHPVHSCMKGFHTCSLLFTAWHLSQLPKHNYSWDHCLNCRWMCSVSYWISTQLKSWERIEGGGGGIKVNEPWRLKIGQRRNSWQWVKHAWLFSDLLQA